VQIGEQLSRVAHNSSIPSSLSDLAEVSA
jgi:hypothetical protein